MKKILTQYGGLKKEIYILFAGKLVTAMGSFVWPMLTFFLTTKLGISDGAATFLVATAGILMLPAALMGGKKGTDSHVGFRLLGMTRKRNGFIH